MRSWAAGQTHNHGSSCAAADTGTIWLACRVGGSLGSGDSASRRLLLRLRSARSTTGSRLACVTGFGQRMIAGGQSSACRSVTPHDDSGDAGACAESRPRVPQSWTALVCVNADSPAALPG